MKIIQKRTSYRLTDRQLLNLMNLDPESVIGRIIRDEDDNHMDIEVYEVLE